MSKKKMRRERALFEITRLKAQRRKGIVQCSIGGILAVLAIFGIPLLQQAQILPYGNMVVSFMTFASAIVACGFLGIGARNTSRSSQAITALKKQHHISDEEAHGL